ncbi:nucleotidyltransferase family protein [Providencia huaxiensis]|uniref:Nucleotidyltransferase family protein n=4 Tax=Morganellaceae TaxID=1903414 RepID=A0A345M1T8_9GAMM|nr:MULTISPECIES: nucleotidyltransferase family protein [Providencia]AXH64328.1 nucleotidyltransferase family protein [Providencia huaxiensis]MBN6361261.1 nucleotidyltransferase family protein [Providencia huaxiensis]MBQ0268828.1 nucleotidyltransferase family protein [Providencia huaxiensis]MBQ0536201.1 nucleotidyltransferase family protein [Providencia huaxiensis]MBQ0590573.1 nucleotidyltransferase family protein [Providencia huaxiensis]
MNIGILILAAGKSERFQNAGGKGSKLNFVLEENTVFEKTLCNSIDSGLPMHVVTRPENEGVINNCLQFNIPYSLINSNGLGDSIAFGVKNTSNLDGWIIHLADMPYINSHLFIRVANKLKQYTLVRPVYNGLPGHPVGISAKYYSDLIKLSGDEGAKSILQNNFVYKLDINDENVVKDIDYPSVDNE